MEAFEMREVHRQLLARHRLYLLHNLRPTETFWSTLYAKEVLSQDMIDEVKACRVMSSQVGLLLDMLPARGPTAFDNFCEALLECDHSHVAEYLKTLEATDHFRIEVQPLTSDVMLDRLVSIFKKNTPTVQRFAERKFELLLEEQERDLNQKEQEVQQLDTQITMLTLEVSQLRNFLSSCTETSDNLIHEIQRDFLSKMFLREERKHLENLRLSLKDINGFEKMCQFYTNMQKLLSYLERHAGVQMQEGRGGGSGRRSQARQAPSAQAHSLHDKMTVLMHMIIDLVDDLGTRPQIQGHVLRAELEKVLRNLKEVMSDVWRIRDVFRSTVKQKRRLEGEVLSLLHNLQEIRRLEREVKEKQSHINDLNKQGQVMKKKTKHHKKQLEQIHLNMEQRKIQMMELQKTLERQLNSADQRLHAMLTLLPDLEDSDLIRSDTDLTSDMSGASRLNTPDLNRLNTPYRPASAAVAGGSAATNLLTQKLVEEVNVLPVEESEKAQNSTTKAASKTSDGSSSKPGAGGVLLERRKAKQGLLSKEPAYVSKDGTKKGAKDLKLPTKSEKNNVMSKKTNSTDKVQKDSVKTGESKSKGDAANSEDAGIDIDKWVANEKSRTKVDELQQKLANFKPTPTEDRTAEMENIRGDIDAKISEITSRNKKPANDVKEKPPDGQTPEVTPGSSKENMHEIKPQASQGDSGVNSAPQSGSGSGSLMGSRSGSGSDKENAMPSTAPRTVLNPMTSQELPSDGIKVPSSSSAAAQTGEVASPSPRRRPSRLDSEREVVAASFVCMEGENMPAAPVRQGTRYIEPDSWVPPKKRFNEREALKANKIEIRLPSK